MNDNTFWSKAGFLFFISLLVGCAAAEPRFSPDVQKSFREYDMRRMETEELKVYYPEHRREEALHIAAYLEKCLHDLHEVVPRPIDWGQIPVFVPEVEFNNAYVTTGPGEDPNIVLPTFFTANLFGKMGFTPSAAAVGCHEMVHYVQFTQMHGFYSVLRRITGPWLNPQIGLDLWFLEGLATYYESKLVEGVGRYGSPIWESYFAAGIQEGHLDGGRLNFSDREVAFGGPYLVGSYFVAYLADTYGEEKLWELVDRQGSSLLFLLAVSNRFRKVYGKTLGRLIKEFEEAMREEFPARERSPEQESVRWVGESAMLEVGPNGLSALYSRGFDEVRSIEVFDANGDRLLRRRLPDLFPGRQIVGFALPEAMRFSPEGDSLYFLVFHMGRDGERTSLMRLDLDRNRLNVVRDDLQAVGGDITPEGDAFIVAAADGDRVAFYKIDLVGDDDRELFRLPPGAYVGWIRLSPDGGQMSFTLMQDEEWSVAVVDAQDGELIGKWTTGKSHHPAFDAVWLDDERLLFSAAFDGRVEVMEADLTDGSVLRRSEVPYMAFNPRPLDGGGVQFLNRQGWGWSLDRLQPGLREPTEQVYWEDGVRRGGSDFAEITGYGSTVDPVVVSDDRAYSSFDGLFVPRLVMPGGFASRNSQWVSLQAMGRDELGFHNWAFRGQWDFITEQPSGFAEYVNTQLAPWFLGISLADDTVSIIEDIDEDTGEATARRLQRSRSADVFARRRFFDIPVLVAFRAGQFFREEFEDEPEENPTLVGVQIASQYLAYRFQAYGGAQWLAGLTGSAAFYPEQLGSDFALGDGSAQLEVHTPLPISKRHRLRLSGRFRGLTGVPDGQNLLRIGGFEGSPVFSSREPTDDLSAVQLVPPGFSFVEPLRGYEDFHLAANQVAIVDVNYRYPIIIDRGGASALMVMPSFFFSGIDLEGFASGATVLEGEFHSAVGASATALFQLWLIPLNFRYQFARRLTDDMGQVHTLQFNVFTDF